MKKKKFIIIAIIGFLGIAALFGNTGEDIPEVAEVDTKTEETQADEVEEKEAQDKAAAEKEQAEKEQTEKEQAEKEQAEKEKAEAERVAKEQAEKDKAAAEKEQQEKEEKLAAEKAAEEKAAKEKAEAEKVANEKDAANLEQVHLSLMREHMGMYVDVTFDKETKIFKMTPTNQQLITEIEMLPLGIGWDNWQDLVDGVASMSKTNSDSLGEGYSVTLVNPLNEENIILWVMDGEVIYNVVDEL